MFSIVPSVGTNIVASSRTGKSRIYGGIAEMGQLFVRGPWLQEQHLQHNMMCGLRVLHFRRYRWGYGQPAPHDPSPHQTQRIHPATKKAAWERCGGNCEECGGLFTAHNMTILFRRVWGVGIIWTTAPAYADVVTGSRQVSVTCRLSPKPDALSASGRICKGLTRWQNTAR